MNDHELVRVSRELIAELTEKESEPVIFVRLERLPDGTCDMHLRTVGDVDALAEARCEPIRAAGQVVLNARSGSFAEINRALDGLDTALRRFPRNDEHETENEG